MNQMREIDGCTVEILRSLLQLSAPISSKKISRNIGVSMRVVHYRINRIKPWLEENGFTLIVKPNYGIMLQAPDDKKKKLLEKINKFTFYSKEKRIYFILLSFFSTDTPLIHKYFEEMLSISRSTVIKEIAQAKKWLVDNKMTLFSKPNYGCWVEGPENVFRESLFNCILDGSYEFKQQNDLMEYCFSGIPKKILNNTFADRVKSYFGEVDFYYLNNLLNTIIDVQLTDRSNYSLILRIAILITRCMKGKNIRSIKSGLGDFKQKNEYYWAEFLSKKIGEYYNLSLGLEEISYITKYLLDAQAQRPVDGASIDPEKIEELDNELINAVDSFICQISKRLHPSLMLDAELKHNLALHIKHTFDQGAFLVSEDNPIIQEIKEEYSRIFFIVSQCIKESDISSLSKFPDEIEYLTIHIATALERLHYKRKNNKTILLVCNTGVASALLLKSKIKSEFPEIIINDVISYKELLKRKSFRGIDFIISTIQLKLFRAPPVLVVDVLLKEKDIDNLEKAFITEGASENQSPKVSKNDGPRLSTLIDNDLIEIKNKVNNWEDAAQEAGQLLYKNKIVEKRYINSMKNVIREFGSFIVAWPGVALLHATFDSGAKQLGMSLITLDTPVEFGHTENDPVDIVIALSIPADHSIPLALDQLNNMLSCKQAIKIIRSAHRKNTVMNQIKNFSQ